jgi:hypothetical protein
MKGMEKTVRIFESFEEADAMDAEDDLRTSPEERIDMVFELQGRVYPDAAEQGFARVCRVTELEGS